MHYLARHILLKYRPKVVCVRGRHRSLAGAAIAGVLASKFSLRVSPADAQRGEELLRTVAGGGAVYALWQRLVPVRYPSILLVQARADLPRWFYKAVPKERMILIDTDEIERGARFKAIDIRERLAQETRGELGGINFKIMHEGSAVPMHMRNAVGMVHVKTARAAVAAGLAFGMRAAEISQALVKYVPPAGQMRLIAGVKDTVIIDDSGDASLPDAVSALSTLGNLELKEGTTRYAVLADMDELRRDRESGYREVGRAAAVSADVLLGVGVNAQCIVEEAVKAGMPRERVFHFAALAHGVEQFLQEKIKQGDVVLVSGSQHMRMEKLVKGLMADPLRAKELLCRQDKEWMT